MNERTWNQRALTMTPRPAAREYWSLRTSIFVLSLCALALLGLGVLPGHVTPQGKAATLQASTSGVAHASPRWISTSAGNTACAVLVDGGVVCWGRAKDIVAGATQITGAVAVSTASDIGSGGYTGYDVACAILAGGNAQCWGDNAVANSGAPSLTGVVDVSVGGQGVCFVLDDGQLTCFDNNPATSRTLLTSNAVRVSVGTYATCAVLSTGRVDCAGSNWLGHVSGPESATNAVDVSLGDHGACVLDSTGQVKCWGTGTSLARVPVTATQISAGTSGACSLTELSRIYCWGSNPNPSSGTSAGDPVQVSAGWAYGCALNPDGTVSCWGDVQSEEVISLAPTISGIRTSNDVSPPGPDPGVGEWSLSGVLLVPGRLERVLRFVGDVSAPGKGSVGERRVLGVREAASGKVHFLSPATDLLPGVSYYEGSLDVSALRGVGSLELVVAQYQSVPSVTTVFASGLVDEFSLPAVASSAVVTRASRPEVVVGESVVIRAVKEVTWSDGVVTDDTPTGSFSLQFRPTGSAMWESLGSGSASRSIAPKAPGDYRYLVSNQVTSQVFVNVIRPTTAFRVASWSSSAQSAFPNATLVLSGQVENQFDDGTWRAAPVGTKYELQVLASGATSWQRLVRDSVKVAGQVEIRWPMTLGGKYRLVVGEAIGPSLDIELIEPTSVVSLDALSLPTEVAPGEPVDISSEVQVQYSDGVYRPAPDGTEYAVEFAPSEKPVTSLVSLPARSLTWTVVAKGATVNGQIADEITPTKSGYWRVRVGTSIGEPVFVAVSSNSQGAPGAVTKVKVSPAKNGRVVVTWAAPTTGGPVQKYLIRLSSDSISWGQWRDTSGKTRWTVRTTGTSGKRYIQIIASNSDGNSPPITLTLR